MRVALVVYALGLGFAVTACAGGAPGDQPDPQFIRNGTDDPGDPAVVALRTPDGFPFCSATLVAPSVVLTAAHCVAGRGPADVQVFFGTNAFGGGRVEGVVEIVSHPLFNPATLSEHDIAVLALRAPVTDVAPASLGVAPPVGSQVRLVGFGNTEGGNGTHGSKRQGTTTVAQMDDNTLVYDDSPSGICFGDSGGPTFGEGDSVVGVHWAVGGGDPGTGICLPPNFDTRVDTHLDFVQAFIDAHSGGGGGGGGGGEPPPGDPSPCGIPATGLCMGNLLVYCDVDERTAYEVDCSEWDLTCSFRVDSGQYDCN